MIIDFDSRPPAMLVKKTSDDEYEYLGYTDKNNRAWFCGPAGGLDNLKYRQIHGVYTEEDYMQLYLKYCDLIDPLLPRSFFRTVGGDFSCHDNKLTSLAGGPIEVSNFYCQDNQLTSLVRRSFYKSWR
jgi:hypothetical protein